MAQNDCILATTPIPVFRKFPDLSNKTFLILTEKDILKKLFAERE